jgi:hypothetical protein
MKEYNMSSIIKKISILSAILLSTQAGAFQPTEHSVRPSLAFGIGYPKIPLSQFRPPISVVSNAGIHWSPLNKWALEISGYGLKTYSLGTINGQDAALKFNAWWVGADVQYQLRGGFNSNNYVCMGLGRYHLNRVLDESKDNLTTSGFCLGYITHFSHIKHSSVLEVRWHLLFEPDDQPQVLTMTFGVLL